MKPKITFILPSYSEKSAQKVGEWILGLPEIRLIADISAEYIPWKQEVTGSDQDWLSMGQKIADKWADSDGFVVWAPEQSVLELAGVFDLIFHRQGKPVISFSADKPEKLAGKKFALLGLKSVLINATFVAGSEVAESQILSGSHLYRPDGCYWGTNEHDQRVVQSVYDPLATIDFSLTTHTQFDKREDKKLKVDLPSALSKDIYLPQWVPSISNQFKWPDAKPKAMIVQADANYWHHPDIQKIRKQALKDKIATVWYSNQPWKKEKLHKNEVTISHPQFWWTVLATQFSLGKNKGSVEALRILKSLV